VVSKFSGSLDGTTSRRHKSGVCVTGELGMRVQRPLERPPRLRRFRPSLSGRFGGLRRGRRSPPGLTVCVTVTSAPQPGHLTRSLPAPYPANMPRLNSCSFPKYLHPAVLHLPWTFMNNLLEAP